MADAFVKRKKAQLDNHFLTLQSAYVNKSKRMKQNQHYNTEIRQKT